MKKQWITGIAWIMLLCACSGNKEKDKKMSEVTDREGQ
jgi:uncharacterized lipoprotein